MISQRRDLADDRPSRHAQGDRSSSEFYGRFEKHDCLRVPGPLAVLRPRLLLCLNSLGTNAGFQRMAGLQSGTTAKDLAYIRRRYITADTLRQAIAFVSNGTLHARDPTIWRRNNGLCLDSKHFGAWDQNLTTQWHVRCGGRGVMIYWHVDKIRSASTPSSNHCPRPRSRR